MTYTQPLSSIRRSDLPTAGGKAANLGELLQAGFPVPPGFCVTTDAYRAFLRANALEAEITQACAGISLDDPVALERASSRIRARFEASPVPDEIAAAVRQAYRALGSPPAAVRSSATAEDLPDLSFAGQQDTYLNVSGEEALLQAVVRCWASLWTARAIGYRARSGIAHEDIALAVVVQSMIQSEASGVLFTANPLTGRRTETVIDATLGLGEALVSGQVEPDHYVVEPATGRILSKTLGQKALSVRGQEGGGVAVQPEQAANQQALPDEQILALAQTGQRAAKHFGGPQDIEWAWAGGQMYLVQSRPITSLYPLPENVDPAGEPMVLFSFGAVQGNLEPLPPLGRDIFVTMAASMAPRFGSPGTYATQHTFFTAGERLFMNLTGVVRSTFGRKAAHGALGIAEPVTQGALKEIFADPRLAPKSEHLSLRTRIRLARVFLPLAARVLRNLLFPTWSRERGIQDIETLVRQTSARIRSAEGFAAQAESFPAQAESFPAQAESFPAQLQAIEESLRILPRFILTRMVPLVAAGQASFQPLIRLASTLPEGSKVALELSRGLPYNVTTEMDLVLWDTARQIKANPQARRDMEETPLPELIRQYHAGSLPAGIQAPLNAFLERYGMRGPGEIDLGRPRWREEPGPLLQVLASYLSIDDESLAPHTVFERGAQHAAQAADRLVAALRQTPHGRIKAFAARQAYHRMRELTGLRESPKFCAIRIMGVMREVLLENGRRLAGPSGIGPLTSGGIIDRPDDLFYLHLPELHALAAGEPRDWRALVAARREAVRREARRKQVPRLLLSDGTAFYERAEAPGEAGSAITGSPVSPGVVEGIAHVVIDPRGAQLAPGEILVCPATDPGWTPLFLAAGGLVMEIGGMMTHGSVVAREYGIPAVVGVAQATQRLRTGMRIRVDGTQGAIYIIEEEE